MTLEEIKELDDNTLIKKLMEEVKVDKLVELSNVIDIPHSTMTKWKCKDGVPTEFPKTGGYKRLFQSLLLIELQTKEFDECKKFFKDFSKLSIKYQ